VGIYSIKPKFQRTLKPIENGLVRWHVHPTIINLAGLALSLLAAGAILASSISAWWLLAVPLLVNSRTACNALDGLVARRLGYASRFGEVLNEMIDRVSDTAIFGSLYFLPGVNGLLAIATLIVILLNSYLSILSKAAGGSRQYGGVMGKADRMIYISVASLAVWAANAPGIWNWFLAFTLAGTAVTFIQRFNATYKELAKQ